VKACYQAFGHQGANLLLREIDHCDDKLSHQLFWRVEMRYLGAGLLDTELFAEVYMQYVSGLSSLGKWCGIYDAANAEFHFRKVIPRDCLHCSLLTAELSRSRAVAIFPP
jgi:hypothetical protein